jgi:hypothetical protein
VHRADVSRQRLNERTAPIDQLRAEYLGAFVAGMVAAFERTLVSEIGVHHDRVSTQAASSSERRIAELALERTLFPEIVAIERRRTNKKVQVLDGDVFLQLSVVRVEPAAVVAAKDLHFRRLVRLLLMARRRQHRDEHLNTQH